MEEHCVDVRWEMGDVSHAFLYPQLSIFVSLKPQTSIPFLVNCVKLFLGSDAAQPEIVKENDKPIVKNYPLFLSLSHSGDATVAAVCNAAVGVDVEKIKPLDFKKIGKRFFKATPSSLNGFFEAWTAKEAIKKATDISFFDALKCEDFSFVKHIDALDGYKLAVCCKHNSLKSLDIHCCFI
jgi:phosphopantetheinyl transferase